MPKLRFIGAEQHAVPILNRTVDPDELVEVDEATFKAHEWPESLWSVPDAKAKTSTKPEGN